VGRRSSASTFPFQTGAEGIGALRPKRGLLSDPSLSVLEGLNADAEPVFAAAHLPPDKACGFEHTDVARDGGERHGQGVDDDPSRFVHLFIFDDETAHHTHGNSDAVQAFESVYRPELVGGLVVFTDYQLVAANREF
jgi:hypothetical protein